MLAGTVTGFPFTNTSRWAWMCRTTPWPVMTVRPMASSRARRSGAEVPHGSGPVWRPGSDRAARLGVGEAKVGGAAGRRAWCHSHR